MNKIWHRGIIKYLQKKGLAPKDIHADMVATLGMMLQLYQQRKSGQLNSRRVGRALKMTQRSGRLASATTQEKIDRVHHMVMDDRRLIVNQIADAVAISREQVWNILHHELGMLKVPLGGCHAF